MKRAAVVTLALVLAVWGVALAADVMVVSRDLPVFDENGKKVDPAIAKATGFAGRAIGYDQAQNIKISASVSPVLKITLSSTEIAWQVKRAGVYQIKAIDIATDTGGFMIDGAQDANLIGIPNRVTMNVQGAADLAAVRLDPTTSSSESLVARRVLPTYYALQEYPVLTSSSEEAMPRVKYQDAKSFNGSHVIGARTSLWNKINVADGGIGGQFQDDFTVTFSRVF